MADEEQFSLCWNNFNSNLSAGFHESLCKGDLVDVTLAAEGQLVKAHRLVLSVCSPYFRKMFTQMPSNQHAFVFLKDVSHAALKDLIQFMYCGEVNVKQDALPTFISTAEALQIKGLTETGEPTTPTQTPTPASQSPLKAPTPIPTSHNIMTSSSPRSRIHHQQQQQQQQQHQQQRNQNRGSYKAESESETDDKVITSTPAGSSSTIQMVSQKRVLQRSLTPQTSSGGGSAATVAKRPKIITTTSTSSGDPLESGGETIIAQPQTTSSTTTTHIITTISDPKNVSDEPEFIELPIETIPTTKSEPDYGDEEESGEVETVDQDATYVEDDSYGDMKYDESYFTENDDAKPGASGGTGGGGGGGFSDTYTDQSVTEAQDLETEPSLSAYELHFMDTRRRKCQRYRKLWEEDENLKAWLCEKPKGKAYCLYCERILKMQGGKKDLLKHGRTEKHKKNEMLVREKFQQEISRKLNVI